MSSIQPSQSVCRSPSLEIQENPNDFPCPVTRSRSYEQNDGGQSEKKSLENRKVARAASLIISSSQEREDLLQFEPASPRNLKKEKPKFKRSSSRKSTTPRKLFSRVQSFRNSVCFGSPRPRHQDEITSQPLMVEESEYPLIDTPLEIYHILRDPKGTEESSILCMKNNELKWKTVNPENTSDKSDADKVANAIISILDTLDKYIENGDTTFTIITDGFAEEVDITSIVEQFGKSPYTRKVFKKFPDLKKRLLQFILKNSFKERIQSAEMGRNFLKNAAPSLNSMIQFLAKEQEETIKNMQKDFSNKSIDSYIDDFGIENIFNHLNLPEKFHRLLNNNDNQREYLKKLLSQPNGPRINMDIYDYIDGCKRSVIKEIFEKLHLSGIYNCLPEMNARDHLKELFQNPHILLEFDGASMTVYNERFKQINTLCKKFIGNSKTLETKGVKHYIKSHADTKKLRTMAIDDYDKLQFQSALISGGFGKLLRVQGTTCGTMPKLVRELCKRTAAVLMEKNIEESKKDAIKSLAGYINRVSRSEKCQFDQNVDSIEEALDGIIQHIPNLSKKHSTNKNRQRGLSLS